MEQELTIYHKRISETQKLILYFILYAFLGWIMETIYAFYIYGHFVKRGFLFGPICPIYGFGGVLLYISLKNIKGNNWTKFFVSMVAFSNFEFVASYLLETAFHQRWWDYSNEFLNIQGRVCLSFSLFWGIVGVLFINVIHPFMKKHVEKILLKIPYTLQEIIVYVLLIEVWTDFVLSVLKYIKI